MLLSQISGSFPCPSGRGEVRCDPDDSSSRVVWSRNVWYANLGALRLDGGDLQVPTLGP